MIRVEPARRLDALPSLALHRAVLEEGRWFVTAAEEFDTTLELREWQIERLNQADNSAFLVARRPEVRVAGWLTLNGGALARTRHVARLEVMVDPAHRRAGVGRALVEAAQARAARGGVLRKVSLAVLADNAPAIALYRALGFTVEGHRVGEYLEPGGEVRDDLLMAWTVPSGAPSAEER
ncbi:MAG: GNAT family N-acetyltransferase [Myxococcota bacterium]